jgi:hypothetical protein
MDGPAEPGGRGKSQRCPPASGAQSGEAQPVVHQNLCPIRRNGRQSHRSSWQLRPAGADIIFRRP